jgi:hypothetical protein
VLLREVDGPHRDLEVLEGFADFGLDLVVHESWHACLVAG